MIKNKKGAVRNFIFLMLLFINTYNGTAQTGSLFELGENLIDIVKSDNSDKAVDFIDDKLDLDQKAQIMESFLTVNDQLTASMKQDKLQLFNVIKENGSVYFIVFDGNKFKIIKGKVNNDNRIIDNFTIVYNKVANLIKQGSQIYKKRCYSCHGKFAQGGIGPNLTDNYWIYINSDQDLYDVVYNGKKGTMMLAFKNYLKPDELKTVLIYIKALQNKKQKKPKKNEGKMKNIKLSIFN